MSNFRALGFTIESRDDAVALARAPVQEAPPSKRLHESEAVDVHRLEIGAGIELWSILQGDSVVASYPTYLARGRRDATVRGLSFPHTPLTPRLWLDEEPPLAFQLVNYLYVPPEALAPGSAVRVAITALAGAGFEPSSEPPAITAPPRTGRVTPENVYYLVGEVLESERFDNPRTGAPLRWWRLALGAAGEIEAVCHAADAPAEPSGGDRVAGVVTLRGAIAGFYSPDDGGEDETPERGEDV